MYLCGGADRLEYPPQYNYETATDSKGKLKDGSAYVHTFLADNPTQPIPIHLLKDETGTDPIYFLQRTFILGTAIEGGAVSIFGTNSEYKIKPELLPRAIKVSGTGDGLKIEEDTANPPTTYYFRVTPCAEFGETRPFARYSVDPIVIDSESSVLTNPISIGASSAPYPLQVSRDTTVQYQQSVESALLALLLSRPDLDNVVRSTPFLDVDRQKLSGYFGISPQKFFSSDVKITNFRKRLRNLVRNKAVEIINSTGVLSKAVEQFVVDSSVELRDFKWSDYDDTLPSFTLRGSANLDYISSEDTNSGIAPNTKSMVIDNSKERKIRKLITSADLDGAYPASARTSKNIEIPLAEYDTRLQGSSNGDSTGNIFKKAQAEKHDYLSKGLVRDSSGNRLVITRDGEQYVLLQSKSDYMSSKKEKDTSGQINGNSPLVYGDRMSLVNGLQQPKLTMILSAKMYFTRTVLLDHSNGQILEQAAFVLNIATSSIDKKSDSDWDFVRLGENGVMLLVEQFLNTILNTVQAILDGLQGVIDNILRFIDFIQQRINEVQNLIRKINAIVQSIGLFDIPSVNMLFFASKGTDGVTGDLVSSQDKPQDSPSAFGFGAMGLMPIPLASVILDLFFPDTDIDGLVDDIISGGE